LGIYTGGLQCPQTICGLIPEKAPEYLDGRGELIHEDGWSSQLNGPMQDSAILQNLEKKLPYEHICLYRSIARAQFREDVALKKKQQVQQQSKPVSKQGWTSWLWGSSSATEVSGKDAVFGSTMTNEQRKELYDVLDYDEQSIVGDLPGQTLMAIVVAKLDRGTFSLKLDPHGNASEVVSLVYETFEAGLVQRPTGFDASISLHGFGVVDGTTKSTIYRQIVQVKDNHGLQNGLTSLDVDSNMEPQDPFFFVKFERNPVDPSGSVGNDILIVRMRHMEIIYHKGYVEAMYDFFKPPDAQLESAEALLVRFCLLS
jgi:vacuolar protein sorting-associated protein 13A/C